MGVIAPLGAGGTRSLARGGRPRRLWVGHAGQLSGEARGMLSFPHVLQMVVVTASVAAGFTCSL